MYINVLHLFENSFTVNIIILTVCTQRTFYVHNVILFKIFLINLQRKMFNEYFYILFLFHYG